MTYNEHQRNNLRYYLWRTGAILAAASIIYYIPTLFIMAGWIAPDGILNTIHNFYGIDIYAMIFFAPVAYAAYKLGVKVALLTAFTCMIVLFPFATTKTPMGTAMLQPTALGIILGAVGSAIAMLQRSEEQQRQRTSELNCLYRIGNLSQKIHSIEKLLNYVVNVIERTVPNAKGATINFKGSIFSSSSAVQTRYTLSEELPSKSDFIGILEINFTQRNKRQKALIKAIAERISAAIREIELQQELGQYYLNLEEMVENRTKLLEEAQSKLVRSERLAAVGELASAVSHELRNPLNVIQNCVYLLEMSIDDMQEDVTGTLQMIKQQVALSNRIVTDLLDFTRVKPPMPISTGITSMIEKCLSITTIPINIKIIKNYAANGSRVVVDSDQIERAVSNIMNNALQAITRQGEIRITTSIEEPLVHIDIEDSGCGIPEENMIKIFEPLFTTKPKGIGLGMAITRRLIELNRGNISVKSRVNQGTTFSITFPLEQKGVMINEGTTKCTCSR